jgi:hypothetical protein
MNRTPDMCKGCTHRYNDYTEGQNCGKINHKIMLSSGATLDWPGYAVHLAAQECKGAAREPALFGRLTYWIGL